MIRLFAPPTPDAVIRRNAMTAGSLVFHGAILAVLFVPITRVVKRTILDQLAVYLVPPDNLGGQEHPMGEAPVAAVASNSGDPSATAPATTPDPFEAPPARGTVPLLSMANLHPASLLRAEDHAFTELQVDFAVVRDPNSAAPQYPRSLLEKGIEGSAAVLYVVDSVGTVDTTTYRVVKATHGEFVDAVRRALPDMRFHPAIQNGHPVRQLVEQTFRFRINRADSVRAPSELRPPA